MVREITKKFESVSFSSLKDGYTGTLKGEFVVLIEGYVSTNNDLLSLSIDNHIQFYLDQGIDKQEVIKIVAKERGLKKNEVYQTLIKMKK